MSIFHPKQIAEDSPSSSKKKELSFSFDAPEDSPSPNKKKKKKEDVKKRLSVRLPRKSIMIKEKFDKLEDKKRKSVLKSSIKSSESIDAVNDRGIFPKQYPVAHPLCVYHKKELKLFNSTVEEPICFECTIYGPHNSPTFTIIPIEQAYYESIYMFQQKYDCQLREKQSLLVAQSHRLNFRIQEIQEVKNIIERDVNNEFWTILERLRFSYDEKMSLLQNDTNVLQNDIDKINFLEKLFNSSQARPLDFMLRYRVFRENIENIITKPFKVLIDVFPYDLPRDLAENRRKQKLMKHFKEIDEFKKEIIVKAVNFVKDYKKHVSDSTINEELQEEKKIIQEHYTHLTNELKKFQLVCHFCGCELDPSIVNKKCPKNNKSGIQSDGKGFTRASPKKKHYGDKSHFWGDSIQESYDKKKKEREYENKINLEDAYNENVRGSLDENEEQIDPKFVNILQNLKKNCKDSNYDLLKICKQFDKYNTGKLNSIKFSFILNEYGGISVDDVHYLMSSLQLINQSEIKLDFIAEILEWSL